MNLPSTDNPGETERNSRNDRGQPLPVTPADGPVPEATYRDVLHVPYTARLLSGTLIGRLPNSMAPLAILIHLGTAPGTGFGSAGALAALYLMASAVGGPVAGRLVDRYGQTTVFSVGATMSGAALVAVAAGPGPLWCAGAAVLVAGATKAPLEAGLRALLSGPMMPTRSHRRVALILESASQEVTYIAGPLLVAGIAAATSAYWALLMTAFLGIVGAALVVTAPPSRTWTGSPGRTDWRGPIRSPGLRALCLAMVWVGVPIGAITPLALAAANRYHDPALSGALPAALSVGAVLGGLVYGARAWPGTTGQHLVILSGAFAAGWLVLIAADSPATALIATAVPGLVMAPLLGAAFLVTSALAPRGTVTEAQALLVAALDVGCALGTAAAEILHEVLLPIGAAVGALILVTFRHRLTSITPADRHGPLPAPPNPLPTKETTS